MGRNKELLTSRVVSNFFDYFAEPGTQEAARLQSEKGDEEKIKRLTSIFSCEK